MALTPKNPSNPSAPNDLTEQGTGSVAIPNDLTEQSAGSVAIPNNLTEQSAGSVAIPNNLTEQSAGSVAIPNNLTEQSAGSVAIPNNLTEQAVSTIPRTLDPILKLDFENEVYETTSNQGLDDIVTYTRNSSASFWNRRQDEQGRWETFLDTDYVGTVTNLLDYSNTFEDVTWTKSDVSVTDNEVEDYQGNKTATYVYPTSSGTNVGLFNRGGTAGTDKTASIDVKSAGWEWVRLVGTDGAGGTWFNLITGVIGAQSSGTSNSKIIYLGNGWYRISISDTGVSNSYCWIVLADDDNTSTTTTDGTNGIYISRAQLVDGVKDLPYVPTTTTSASDTFVESPRLEYDPITADPLGYLAEGASTNFLLRSEEIDSASWSKARTTTDPNSYIALDGTRSADAVLETIDNNTHYVSQNYAGITSGLTYTASVYVKPIGDRDLFIQFFSSGGAFPAGSSAIYNLSTGEVTSTGAGIDTATITSVGNGWYRATLTITAVGTSSGAVQIFSYNGATSFAGDTSSGLVVWGTMLENLPFSSSYIRTEGATVQRNSDDMTGSIYVSGEYTARSVNNYLSSDDSFGGNPRYVLDLGTGSSERIILFNQGGTSGGAVVQANGGVTQATLTGTTLNSEAFIDTVLTVKNDEFILYNDGVFDSQDLGGTAPSATEFDVGYSVSTAGRHLYGHVKLVSVYDQLLTASEVALGDSLSGITEAVIPALSAPNNLTEQAVGAVSAPNQLANEPTTNLFLYSEQFDNAYWAKNDVTILENQIADINGLTTVDRVEANSTASLVPRVVLNSITLNTNSTYTISVYARRSDLNWLQIYFGSSDMTNDPFANFNLLDGTIGQTRSGTASIQRSWDVAGSIFYRCSFTVNTDATSNIACVFRIMRDNSDRALAESYTSGEGIFLWGAQLEETAGATSYLKTESTSLTEGQLSIPNNLTEQAVSAFPRTFAPLLNLDFANEIYATNDEPSALDDIVTYTRNSSASFWNRRLNRNGKWETFLDTDYVGSVTNLVPYSEDFSQWTTTGAPTVTTDVKTVDGVVFDLNKANGASDGIYNEMTLSTSTKYRLSILAINDGSTRSRYGLFDPTGVDWQGYLDVSWSNAVPSISSTSGTVEDIQFEFLGNDVYRISFTSISDSANTAHRFYYYSDNSGTTTGGVFLANAQLTASQKNLPYVKTLSTSASETFVESPRLEYDPITAEPLGYLAEGASTNLSIRSEEFDTWSTTEASITTNQSIAPDGTKSMDRLTDTTANSGHFTNRSGLAGTTNTDYTISVYAKKGTLDNIILLGQSTLFAHRASANFNLNTGVVSSTDSQGEFTFLNATIKPVGNNIYRCSVTFTSGSTEAFSSVVVFSKDNDEIATSYAGDGSGTVEIWGFQAEALPFASSYIRTEGSTVQRVADDMTATPSLNNQGNDLTADVVYRCNGDAGSAQTQCIFRDSQYTNVLFYANVDFSPNNVSWYYGASRRDFGSATTPIDDFQRATLVADQSTQLATPYIDGVASGSPNSLQAITPNSSGVEIGQVAFGSNALFGHINNITFYREALTAQEVSLL